MLALLLALLLALVLALLLALVIVVVLTAANRGWITVGATRTTSEEISTGRCPQGGGGRPARDGVARCETS